MTEPNFVSVIIPVYNDQSGLQRCLDALAGQSHATSTIEVVAVDNGSSPPLTINKEYPFKVRIKRYEKPGSYGARNMGAASAIGDVLAFTDADCWPDTDWLARGMEAMKGGNGNFIIGGEVELIRPNPLTAVALYQCSTGFGQDRNIHEKHFSATANLLCTRAQFKAVGPFDETLLSGGDLEWCWRAVNRGMTVRYEPRAIIRTLPRSTLGDAIRQARRVVAGRLMLRKLGLAHLSTSAITKERSGWQSVIWILANRNLSAWNRLRILWVAVIIRAATAVERMRLGLGGRAERQ